MKEQNYNYLNSEFRMNQMAQDFSFSFPLIDYGYQYCVKKIESCLVHVEHVEKLVPQI